MNEIVSGLVSTYLQIGFMALFSLTVLGLGVWYLTIGRKEAKIEKARKDKLYADRYALEHEDRQAIAVEIARSGKVIENCTAVINNNSKIIEESCVARYKEAARLDQLLKCLDKQDQTLETIVRNQCCYMERQKTEYELNLKNGGIKQ